jgi:hypothetical protein
VPRFDPSLIESFPVKFGILIDMIDRPLKAFQLKALQLPFRPNLWHERLCHDFPPPAV